MERTCKSLVPEFLQLAFRHGRRHWRQWRYGKRGVPVRLCGELLRFKLGYEPVSGMAGKFWEDDRLLMQVFYEAISPGQTVLDVGAFVGHYALLAARKVGQSGHVVAFEPVPATYRVLIEHLILNDLLDRVDVWPFAAGRRNEFVKIYFQKNDPVRGHNSTSPSPFEQKGLTDGLIHRTVPCVALGPFLDSLDIKPDIVKIDIEGTEIEVLQSLSRILHSDAMVFCELHPQLWSNPDAQSSALHSFLEQTGRFPERLNGDPVSIFQHEPVVLKKTEGANTHAPQQVGKLQDMGIDAQVKL